MEIILKNSAHSSELMCHGRGGGRVRYRTVLFKKKQTHKYVRLKTEVKVGTSNDHSDIEKTAPHVFMRMKYPNTDLIYKVPFELCSRFVVYCVLLWFGTGPYAHVLHSYLTGISTITRLTKCQWRNLEKYGWIDHMNPLWFGNTTKTK